MKMVMMVLMFVALAVGQMMLDKPEPNASGWLLTACALGLGAVAVRQLRDASHKQTKALPAAAASASCTAIDLGPEPKFVGEQFELELSAPAVPALVDDKTIIYTFEDSADNSSFAAIAELSTLTQLGAGGVGAAAAVRAVRLPSSVRQYVRVTAAVLTAGGNNTAASFSLQLVG
jgi:hypothetical protein